MSSMPKSEGITWLKSGCAMKTLSFVPKGLLRFVRRLHPVGSLLGVVSLLRLIQSARSRVLR